MTRIRCERPRERVRDQSLEVVAPSHETEFEVQAFIWRSLNDLGINARGEVRCVFAGKSQVRFDIAVFSKENRLIGIVEVKREDKVSRVPWNYTRQAKRYHQFGVPVYLVQGMRDAHVLLKDVSEGRIWKVAK